MALASEEDSALISGLPAGGKQIFWAASCVHLVGHEVMPPQQQPSGNQQDSGDHKPAVVASAPNVLLRTSGAAGPAAWHQTLLAAPSVAPTGKEAAGPRVPVRGTSCPRSKGPPGPPTHCPVIGLRQHGGFT